ncbi:MAG: histidine kinase, partial [Myxococcales bacterium]|nr:histidine kinase [Myxococcales bacterium]
GPGIPPEIQGRMFEPLFTTKAAGEGTGLGLSISKEIVERYGGLIEVASQAGQGATFTVKFPALDDSADSEIGSH